MTTIREAVKRAFDGWSADGTDEETMGASAEDLALEAVEEWKAAREEGVAIPETRDTSTIVGAVLSAMDDWAGSDHDIEEMESLVDQFVQRGIEDWTERDAPPFPAYRNRM